MRKTSIFFILCGVVALVSVFLLWRNDAQKNNHSAENAKATTPYGTILVSASPPPLPSPSAMQEEKSAAEPTVKLFSAAAIAGVSNRYHFSGYVPVLWSAEVARTAEAINFYNMAGPAQSHLENSQIFIRYFQASIFLTPPSVKILSRKEIIVAGRPAMDYIVEKKPGYPNFPNQPSWRNGMHRVVDVRASDANPSLFYVFAKNPDLPDEIFEAFLNTLDFNPKNLLFYPGEYFPQEITKKPFGIFVNHASSPVFPERFSGYHTGADVEVPETISPTATIPIFAITDGVVVLSRWAKGYGGVVAIRHTFQDASFLAVYGHLNPKTLLPSGRLVQAGQTIGALGKALSKETDGERRHLHFGMYAGDDTNIAGYVSREEELSRWKDPVKWFADRMP